MFIALFTRPVENEYLVPRQFANFFSDFHSVHLITILSNTSINFAFNDAVELVDG